MDSLYNELKPRAGGSSDGKVWHQHIKAKDFSELVTASTDVWSGPGDLEADAKRLVVAITSDQAKRTNSGEAISPSKYNDHHAVVLRAILSRKERLILRILKEVPTTPADTTRSAITSVLKDIRI